MDSIDNCKSLEEITKRRLEAYEVQVANGDNYEGVLVGIYEKPTHFVYELLQNADDALATEVCFELNSDKLVFYHNGSKDFNLKDIISITGVGNSTKKNDKSVGKFGVGFKSVFAITDTPLIYNRAFNFRIEHLTIPYEMDPDDLNGYTTKFVLPFNSSKNKNDNSMIIEKISEELSGLDCATIMFLRNINKIHINDRGKESGILLNREELENYELVQDLGSEKSYYLFKDNGTNISFSFLIEDDKICPLSDVYLYSFLPTRIRSELPFYVDAPFDLATTRESIEFDSEKNKEILNQIAAFFKDVLLKLCDEQYINQDFLNNILPVDGDIYGRSRIYDRLYDELVNILNETEILPTAHKKYINANDGVLPLTKEMTILSDYSKAWLDIDYSHSKIRSFLANKLGVERVSILDFSRYLADNGILKRKNNEWLLDYYALCVNHYNKNSGWYEKSEANKLKEVPIIKTRTGKFVSAYIDEDAQVFRYSKGIPSSKLIHGLFTSKNLPDNKKEEMRRFLSMLDIKERSPRQYIESTILAEWNELSNKDKKNVFFKICDIYNSASSPDKSEIASLLKNYRLFPTIHDGKKYRTTASELMRGTEEQKIVFKKGAFLQEDYWTDVIEKDKKNNVIQRGSKDLCLALGVIEEMPISTESRYECYYGYDVDDNEKSVLKEKYGVAINMYPQWWYSRLNTINDFKTIASSLKNESEVAALVTLLSKVQKEYIEDEVSGNYGGRARIPQIKQPIPASYIRTLNDTAWVFINGRRRRTREISKDSFIKQFRLTGSESFLDRIDFKKKFEEVATEEEKRAIKICENLSDEELKEVEEFTNKLREKRLEKKLENIITEQPDINEVFPNLKNGILVEDESATDNNQKMDHKDNGGINKHKEPLERVHKQEKATKDKLEKESEINKKELGDAVEQLVNKVLKEKYSDCVVNWFGGNNQGYDFAISKNNEDIKYIESKAVADFNGRINITSSEWRLAKDKKDAYEIYIINANTCKYRVIKNPFQKYIDGEIDIDVDAIVYPV